MNKENQEIQAIGRTLSEINILRIRRIHQLAEQVLDSAGVINTPAYTNVTELKVEAQAETEEDPEDSVETLRRILLKILPKIPSSLWTSLKKLNQLKLTLSKSR
jgi:trimethylamine:corrinoid methyltransferase-like protein